MNIFRSALSACVMSDLSDIEYYMPEDRDRLSEEGRKQIEKNRQQQSESNVADESGAAENEPTANLINLNDRIIIIVPDDDDEDDDGAEEQRENR